MKIKDIEIIWLDVPFHPIPDRHMARQQNGWHISELCRVTTDNGLVGIGETLPHYTWGRVTEAALQRAKGANPFDLLWDDSLGAGLQMALFDVAGKAAGVPAYRLLGKKAREWCPIAWWGIDMSPEDYASEARDAVKQGYTAFKQKARPWWDVYEQARLTCEAVDSNFKLDFDFNDMMVNAGVALTVVEQLDRYYNIAIYESPIPQADVEGNRKIRQNTRCAIAMHYGHPAIMSSRAQDICDGYVVPGGAHAVMKAAHHCQEVNMPFWLQHVGTGITTTFAMHMGAASTHAQWPAVTCMNMYVDQLITEPLTVKSGFIRVSEAPGLGIEFNEDALRFRVPTPDKPNVDALFAFVRDDGSRTWYISEFGPKGFWNDFLAGNQPLFDRGVKLEQWENDGSTEWQDLYKRAADWPVRTFETA
jgi:L-alanine-DL-glutamate epimerase-like enolase superfamily enzyme